MSLNKKEFISNLDSVLELFQYFKENIVNGNTKADINFMDNFEEIIKNYKIIRDEIPEDMVSNFGMPIQIMALQLVEQLRKELELQRIEIKAHSELKKIDEQLNNPQLTIKEINELLDKRLSIRKIGFGG